MTQQAFVRLAIALGIGLLIGAERERRKGTGPSRGPAGIRTFSLAALSGGMSLILGGEILLAATALTIAGFAMLAYYRTNQQDPGLTSEFALLTTTLLGALAIRQPTVATGFAVIVAILLAARNRIHRFVQEVLTEQELHDLLFFAGASLVILPLTPDRPIGPFGVLNLRVLCQLAITVMFISSAGYVALRTLGAGVGLPLTGLTSGFVSSVATIGSMGARVAKQPEMLKSATAGAVLSTVSTVVQMAIVLWVTDRPTLSAMLMSLSLAGITAIIYGLVFMAKSLGEHGTDDNKKGRAFSLSTSIIFAASVSGILLASATVRHFFGSAGLVVAAGLAGFADTHSAAISTASLAAAGKITPAAAAPLVLISLSANTVSKIVVASVAGGRKFAVRVIPGLVLVLIAAWAGLFY